MLLELNPQVLPPDGVQKDKAYHALPSKSDPIDPE